MDLSSVKVIAKRGAEDERMKGAQPDPLVDRDNQLQAGQFGKTAYTGWIPTFASLGVTPGTRP